MRNTPAASMSSPDLAPEGRAPRSQSAPARLLLKVLRIFFDLLYTRLAWAYDAVAWLSSVGQWRTWQRAGLMDLPDGRVLELGHGPGHLLLDMTREGRRAVGLDRSPQMSSLARRRFAQAGLPPVQVRAAADAIPFASGAFATALATFPSEFILESQVISECFRVLAPGADLIVIPAADITGTSLADRLARWLYRATLQSGPFVEAWAARLSETGARAVLEPVRQARAVVWRIRLTSPAAG